MSDTFDPVRSPRLSIVIPVVDDTAAMEETLVSVLEHRPDGCEIVVALGCEYADPWNIREEVRFVQAPPGSSLVRCVNLGMAVSTGPVVHILGCGWRATEGWTDRALEHFDDSDVAAVVPLGVAADDQTRVVSAGVRCSAGGRRIDVAADFPRTAEWSDATGPQGPVLEAGFWRTDVFEMADRGFAVSCGDVLADADMAVTLSRSGRRVVLETHSVVVTPAAGTSPVAGGSFADGVYAERLFWRSIAGSSSISPFLHLVEIARHAVSVAPLGTVGMLVGRLAAALQFGTYVPRYLQLRRLARRAMAAERTEPADEGHVIRMDGPHAGVGRPRRVEPTVLRKSA